MQVRSITALAVASSLLALGTLHEARAYDYLAPVVFHPVATFDPANGIVPFPTSLVDRYILSEQATAALVVYGLGAVLIAIAFAGVFFYATHDGRLIGDAEAARHLRWDGRFFPVGLGSYSLGIALAFASPVASLAVYGLTALFYALPLLPLPASETGRVR